MSKTIELTNGKFLTNDYDRFGSGLTFISDFPTLKWEDLNKEKINLTGGKYRYILGDYWVSKRGTKCFAPKEIKSKHILIYQRWSNNLGESSFFLPDSTKDNRNIYWVNKVSVSITNGCNYAIYPKDWVYKLNIETI